MRCEKKLTNSLETSYTYENNVTISNNCVKLTCLKHLTFVTNHSIICLSKLN